MVSSKAVDTAAIIYSKNRVDALIYQKQCQKTTLFTRFVVVENVYGVKFDCAPTGLM